MVKKRLAIYHFYEESGYVDKYVEHMLREIDSICSRLIIVVNGELQESGREIFRKYTNDLFFRDNIGFDGAAYKDAIYSVGKFELGKYEEVFLCNNSFFGPFIDLEMLFSDAESCECDFWGLSYRNSGIAAFIESYFLVFRKNILLSNALWEYFEQLADIRTYEDVIILFEHGIFKFFHERGFKHGSLASQRKYGSNLEYPYEVMCEDKLPILKKKAFWNNNPTSLQRAIDYIQQNHKEWAELISAWTQRIGILTQNKNVCVRGEVIPLSDFISCVTIQNLQKWIKAFSHIYLFGNGLYSHLLIHLYGVLPQGIIVSDEQWTGESQYNGITIIKRSYFDFEQDGRGIIISVGKKSFEEIYCSFGKRDNILCIWNNES